MHVIQDEVMTSKFHNVSVHTFLVKWQDLWKGAYRMGCIYLAVLAHFTGC